MPAWPSVAPRVRRIAQPTSVPATAISPTVNRLALELTDRQANALAAAISDTIPIAPEIARLQGIALAGVFQIIISESGRRTREGQAPAETADALRPEIETILAELDRWLTPAQQPSS